MRRTSTAFQKFIVSTFIALVSLIPQSRGSHMMGADLTYECLGGNQYRLTLSFYRDCVGINAPSSVTINYHSSCYPGQTFSVTLNPIGPATIITPVCSLVTTTCQGGTYTGIEEWIYDGIVTLPGPCADWDFSYVDCCRNSAITTITGNGSDNMYVHSLLNNTNGICNNSPTFSNRPVPFACVGQRFCFNHGASDADGDSITYQLITPLTSASSTVTYLGGHTNTQPVVSSPAVTFNAATGDICMVPQQAEVTVFAVLVNEYRNGVLIGSVERDIQLTVDNCNNFLPNLTGINGTPVFSANICAGIPFSFYIRSIDIDIPQNTYITWDFGIPGASFTTFGTHRDSAIFSWTPTQSDISTNPYCFTATVVDNNCPYVGVQIFSYCFTVRGIQANAGADETVACGDTAFLSGSATGGSGVYTYIWNPGNIHSPTLLTDDIGTYILAANDGICTNYDTVSVIAGTGVPIADFNFTNNCTGAPVQFTDLSVVTGPPINSWHWDFDDGDTTDVRNPVHQFPTNGTYDVALIISSGSGCVDTLIQQVTINTNVPLAQFTAIDVCQGTAMSFTDHSINGPFNSWTWDFGDPGSGALNTSTSQNPTHLFSQSGTFPVYLNVLNTSGCQNQVQINVTVYPNPTVFVPDAQICEGDQTTLAAPGGFDDYAWNPGGNTQSITVNPPSTTVYLLTVTDVNTCIVSYPVTVTVNLLPTADAGVDQAICEGGAANLSALGGATFIWNPGNLVGQSVSVSPTLSTTYSVVVTSVAGCTGSDELFIQVNPIPSIDAGDNVSICKGATASLSATNGNGSYTWTPGNFNTTSITVSPAITTTYTVTLSDAIGCSGSDVVTVVVNPIPVAAFTSDAPVCIGNTVTFADACTIASGTINSYDWDFGDGNSSNQPSPANLYSTANNYNVELIVASDAGCLDTILNPITINALPIADAGSDVSICPGFNANLSGTGGLQFSWSPGSYNLPAITVSPAVSTTYSLLVTDANGCQNTDDVNVILNPVPVPDAGADQQICFGATTTLFASGGTDYLWSPGNVTTSAMNVTPATTSSYSVLVTNSYGCQAIDQATIIVNEIPVASFSNSGSVCQNNSVLFTDQSAVNGGTITNWSWDFGNNTSSVAQQPSVLYSTPGNYTVRLIVSSAAGCIDTVTQALAIWATPNAGYVHTDVCDGIPVQFTNSSSISDASPLNYLWDLGDMNNDVRASMSHQYGTYGTYPVTLYVSSQNGCRDSISRIINVFAIPDANFSTQAVCVNQPAYFIDGSTVANDQLSTWSWTFGDGGTAIVASPEHTYNAEGNYPIHLVIASQHGCLDSTDGVLRIIPNPIPDFIGESVCYGFPVQMTDLSDTVNFHLVQYNWSFGDGSNSNESSPVHNYSSPGIYQVSLAVTTDSGCTSTAVHPHAVNIFPPPVSQFISNASEANDFYPLVNFVNETQSRGYYHWDFGDSTTSTEYSPTHIYPAVGSYDVELITVDLNGCVDTILSRVEIRPGSTVFIPNSFTPNNDTRNDIFRVYTFNVNHVDAQIFDRWGLKIYEWNYLAGGWDGSVNGNPAQADVYVYRVVTRDVNQKEEVHIGHVSLVR